MWAPESHVCSKYPLIFFTSVAQRLRGEKVSSLIWFPEQLHECFSQHEEGSSMEARNLDREKEEESFLGDCCDLYHRISVKSVTKETPQTPRTLVLQGK